jgi:hypothetical protein
MPAARQVTSGCTAFSALSSFAFWCGRQQSALRQIGITQGSPHRTSSNVRCSATWCDQAGRLTYDRIQAAAPKEATEKVVRALPMRSRAEVYQVVSRSIR